MDESRFYKAERQKVFLQDIHAAGWIFDLGGGGEGIIGQMCGTSVISIDRNKQELVEAKGQALKIVMDAKDLQFLDETFDTATAFFFFMFTLPPNRGRIFNEIYRVLRPGARLLVWDGTIPPFPGGEKEIYIIPLTVILPNGKEIETGYGAPWADFAQSKEDFLRMANDSGFELVCQETNNDLFFLEFRKPVKL
jgi:ubiquinone/menaquinone biosynthesis C-methylase UbiE